MYFLQIIEMVFGKQNNPHEECRLYVGWLFYYSTMRATSIKANIQGYGAQYEMHISLHKSAT